MADNSPPRVVAAIPSNPLVDPPKPPRLWLVLSGLAMTSFGLFLAVQVVLLANPVIVSRPQILAAPEVVIVRWDPQSSRHRVDEVLWGKQAKPDQLVRLTGVPEGPGPLIVAARLTTPTAGRVVPVPGSVRSEAFRAPVYPATPEALHQVRELLAFRASRQESK